MLGKENVHVCISATDPTAWGDVIFAVGAYMPFLHPDLPHIGLFALLALQVALIFTAFVLILGSMAFFVGVVPLQLLHQFTWPLLGAMAGFTILIGSVAMGVFRLGLRRYESRNLLGMQN
jgi:ABC-2 type transport system permease protein